MSDPIPTPDLITSDDVITQHGDTYIVRGRPRTGTAAMFASLAAIGLMAECIPHTPKVRRGNKYRGSDARSGPNVPKLPGKSRNRPCPDCGRKLKRCACAPAAKGAR